MVLLNICWFITFVKKLYKMINYLIVPGLGGSGEKHWQTYFEQTQIGFVRVQQPNWDKPNLNVWVENLNIAVNQYQPESVVLVAHSLGCLTVLEWAKRYNCKIRAAMLVAPPDTELLNAELGYTLFSDFPKNKLDFPSVLVASSNDPWADIAKAENYAARWGSKFVNVGDAGHINQASGHYRWLEGLKLLYAL